MDTRIGEIKIGEAIEESKRVLEYLGEDLISMAEYDKKKSRTSTMQVPIKSGLHWIPSIRQDKKLKLSYY